MSRLAALLALALLAGCSGGVSAPDMNETPDRVNVDPPRVNDDPSPMDGDDEEPSPVDEPDAVEPEPSLPAPSDGGVPDRDSGGELPVPHGSDAGAEPLGEIGDECDDALGCASQWCSAEGVCIEPPPRNIAEGETCHDDIECASEYCSPRAGLFAPGTRLLTGWCEPRPAIGSAWHACTWRDGECVR